MIHFVLSIVLIIVSTVEAMDVDPFSDIKQALSLSKGSIESHPTKSSQTDEPEVTSRKKKWIPPPGYYSRENREKRFYKTLKRKKPTLDENEIQVKVNEYRKKYKTPPNHFKKDVFIERHTNKILEQDPTIQHENAKSEATEKYNAYLKKVLERDDHKKMKNKPAKELVESIDKDLASTMTIRLSNKKQDWIERRTRWLKKRDKTLSHSDAAAQAQMLYAKKQAKETARRRELNRLAKAKSSKRPDTI